MKICADSLPVAEIEASQNLWNQRLGHMSEMFTLKKEVLTTVSKDAAQGPCNHYEVGKQHRVSFNFSYMRKSGVLSLVHSDVCGPLKVNSLSGNKYFLTFIGDVS